MTDIMKLADDYAQHKYVNGAEGRGPNAPEARTGYARATLQSAIEALQGENERANYNKETWFKRFEEVAKERDALAAELATLKAQEPVAWFAFGESNGPIPLELFGWDEKACKHEVLTNARAAGWKGTLDGYLYQQGWTIKPVYAHAAPKAIEKQEPVAYRAWFDADNGARWLFTLWPEEERLDVEWEPLFAAPKALAPHEDTKLLDYLQERQATVEILIDGHGLSTPLFRIGGLHGTICADIRGAIGAAIGIGGTP